MLSERIGPRHLAVLFVVSNKQNHWLQTIVLASAGSTTSDLNLSMKEIPLEHSRMDEPNMIEQSAKFFQAIIAPQRSRFQQHSSSARVIRNALLAAG